MNNNKKIYFFSDIHLGLPNHEKSLRREKLLVKCLDEIKKDAEAIYFVGDIFDFWWEYKKVVPRGFIRFLGKIAEITDSGIPVHFFTGNHDVWMKDYFPEEIGVVVHTVIVETKISDKKILIAHGDGLGPGDNSYKLLKKLFTNKFLQWCYSRLHPNFALGLAHFWSQSRRKKERTYQFLGEDNEFLIKYAKEKLINEHFDFFVFGHRHIPLILKLNETSQLVNTGDWIGNFTFAVYQNQSFSLKTYKNGKQEDYIQDLNAVFKTKIF